MKLLKRLCFFLPLIFLTADLFAQRDAGDTLLVNRPRYFGIFLGRLQFSQAPHAIYDASPLPFTGQNQTIKVTVKDAFHGGLFFTFPFLHRMEWEGGFGVFSFQRDRVMAEVTQITPGSDPQVLAYHTWHDYKNLTVVEFRSYFSVELMRQENYAVLIGAGGWLATNSMPYSLNPGSVGVEGNVTGYYRIHEKSFVQIHLSPGWMRNGYYINFGIAICYEGQRMMRAHPKHYYVRTYDPNE
jgi:hypothetical protein